MLTFQSKYSASRLDLQILDIFCPCWRRHQTYRLEHQCCSVLDLTGFLLAFFSQQIIGSWITSKDPVFVNFKRELVFSPITSKVPSSWSNVYWIGKWLWNSCAVASSCTKINRTKKSNFFIPISICLQSSISILKAFTPIKEKLTFNIFHELSGSASK